MTQLLSATATVTSAASFVAGEQTGGMDYTVLFSILGLLICIILPITVILVGIIKHKGAFRQTLWGMAGFVVFSFILYSVVGAIFMPGYQDQTATDFEAIILIVIRVFCEVLGMYLLLMFTRKRKSLGNALNLGAGYALVECIMIGFLLLCYLMVATSEDIDSIHALRELRVYVQKNNLVAGKEWRFIMRGFTAAVFGGLQISSAVMVFIAVQKKVYWMGLVSVIFALLIRLPNRLHSFDSWFWGNYAVIIPYLAIMTIIACVTAYVMWQKNKDEIIDTKEEKVQNSIKTKKISSKKS